MPGSRWRRLSEGFLRGASGLSVHDLYLVRSLRHYWWLYARAFPIRTPIPLRHLFRVPPQQCSEADEELCARIIRAYRSAIEVPGAECTLSPVWRKLLDARYGRLRALLEDGHPERLSTALASMFSSEFVYGIDTGDLYTGRNWRVYSLKLLDDLVSLSEQLGVVPTESGQGVVGQAFSNGLEALVKATEARLGCSLSIPQVGAPYGLVVGESFLTVQSCEYAYVAWRVAQAIEANIMRPDRPTVLEIGAGVGTTAMFLARLLGPRLGMYTIADLPIVNVLQAYFLGQVFGHGHIRLHGETDRPQSDVRFVVIPGTAVKNVGEVDVLFNENSMPEMLPEVSASYLEWARLGVREFFFSYNQEVVRPDKTSTVATVPEIVATVGGFSRLTRNYSWLRPGYVEEVWAVKPRAFE